MGLKSELAFSNYLSENLLEASKKSEANYEILWSLFIESDPKMFFEENHNHINYVEKLYEKINTRELLNQYIYDYFLAGSGSNNEIDEKSENPVKTFYVNKDGSTYLKPEKEPWEMKMEEDRKEFIKKYPNFEIFYKDLDFDYLLDVINKCWIKALKCNSDDQFENYKELMDHRNELEAELKKMKEEMEALKKLPDPLVDCKPEDFEDENNPEPYYLDEIMDSHNHLKDGRTSEDCDMDSDEYWNQEGAFEEASDKEDNFY